MAFSLSHELIRVKAGFMCLLSLVIHVLHNQMNIAYPLLLKQDYDVLPHLFIILLEDPFQLEIQVGHPP